MEPVTSYVYFIAARNQRKYSTWQEELTIEGCIDVKIGGTKRTIKTRMKELQTGNSKILDLITEFIVPGKFNDAETKYQTQFADKKIINEWYSLDKKDIQIISNLSDMYLMIELQNKRITQLESVVKNLQRCDDEEEDQLYDDLDESVSLLIENPDNTNIVIEDNNSNISQKSGKHTIDYAREFIRYIKTNKPEWYTENKWVPKTFLHEKYNEVMRDKEDNRKFNFILSAMGLKCEMKRLNGKPTRSVYLKSYDALK